jgi:phenylpropionate dioxygenase-like ring-hydroxylating dioxygenase large terminal subunit
MSTSGLQHNPSATGLLSKEVFSQESYDAELANVFGTCWLFVGHTSMIPNSGDYVSTAMGEDPVIVTRSQDGQIHVLLNKCRHRGNRVCLFDKGNSKSFTCSYHGWGYTTAGDLKAVPFLDAAYGDSFDKSKWGLIAAPRVTDFHGLIFASWVPEGPTLREYLGDAVWYLENMMLDESIGGLEVVPGVQRYRMPANWKLLAENFAGDQAHVMVTHASVLSVRAQNIDHKLGALPGRDVRATGASYGVACNDGDGAPHGLLEIRVGESFYQHDLDQAAAIGPEAVDWVRDRQVARQSNMQAQGADPVPYGFHIGNIFPNFSLVGLGTALDGVGLILWLPRGPHETEVWQWCAVNKDAPDSVRRRQREVLMQQQSAAGVFAPDDHENFERLQNNLRSTEGRKWPFNYEMGRDKRIELEDPPNWPGTVTQALSETNQREFYRYWGELMAGKE